jgi:hypothetical protein
MRLTAQEAKNIAYESCKQEIDDILLTIGVAARNKKLSLDIPKQLESATVDYLIKEGGFKVTGSNSSYFVNKGVKYYWIIEWK